MDFNLEEDAGAGDGWQARRRGNGRGGDDGGRQTRNINRRRKQEWKVILAIHAAYLAFNGLLYMVIQIKYQNLGNSPFETHMGMKSSVVALCVYFLAGVVQIILMQNNKKLDNPRLLNHVLFCCGILSPLSNILVFLPNKVGWIVVVMFVFATTILLAHDVFKLITSSISERNNVRNVNATPTPELVELGMTNIHAATTSESTETSTGIDSGESSSNICGENFCHQDSVSEASSQQ